MSRNDTLPANVILFERLQYTALLIFTCWFIAVFTALEYAEQMPAWAKWFIILLNTAMLLFIQVGLIFLAARRRKNWARWTILALFLVSLIPILAWFSPTLFGLSPSISNANEVTPRIVELGLRLVIASLNIFSFYKIFSSEANEWFRNKEVEVKN